MEQNKLPKWNVEEFKCVSEFAYEQKTYKITKFRDKYYLNLNSILELAEEYNNTANYVELFQELDEEYKIVGVVDNYELRLINVDYLYKFKNAEDSLKMKSFFTKFALHTVTYVRTTENLKVMAEIANEFMEFKENYIDDIRILTLHADNLTYFL